MKIVDLRMVLGDGRSIPKSNEVARKTAKLRKKLKRADHRSTRHQERQLIDRELSTLEEDAA